MFNIMATLIALIIYDVVVIVILNSYAAVVLVYYANQSI